MAIGQKLGKVFGAVGSGLSFIPGPWSAVGVALSAAGSTATAVGEAKDRREAEREREQETNEVTQTPTEQPDTSRPQDAAAQAPAAGQAVSGERLFRVAGAGRRREREQSGRAHRVAVRYVKSIATLALLRPPS